MEEGRPVRSQWNIQAGNNNRVEMEEVQNARAHLGGRHNRAWVVDWTWGVRRRVSLRPFA